MNPDLQTLIELQQVDRESARLEAEVAMLPRRVAAIETKLAEARAEVERVTAALKGGEVDRRKLESEIQAHQQKISKYREQSLAVKTNEQYKALMHEIQYAENDIRAAEDRILEIMVSAEEQQRALQAAQAELKAQAAEVEKEKAQAKTRTAEDEAALGTLRERRKTLRAAVSPEALAHYDRVRKVRSSVIAEVYDHKCAACNVMLRPQKYSEALTNEQVLTCDSCGRILYHDAARAAEALAGKAPAEQPPASDSAIPR